MCETRKGYQPSVGLVWKLKLYLVALAVGVGALVGCAVGAAVDQPTEGVAQSEAAQSEAVQSEAVQKEDSEGQQRSLPVRELPYWGLIEVRADEAYRALRDEIEECLISLGAAQSVRKITVKARRNPDEGPVYTLSEVTSLPELSSPKSCLHEVSQRFVDQVGPGYFDDFEVYLATFIHRGTVGGECGPESEHEHVYCMDVGTVEAGDGVVTETSPACPEELLEATEGAMIEARFCRDVAGFHDRMSEFEDRGHRLRAVLFGDVRVEDGRARVVLRYSQPWVESFARCISEHLDEIEVSQFGLTHSCRSQLRNRSIVLWHRPWFVYLFD